MVKRYVIISARISRRRQGRYALDISHTYASSDQLEPCIVAAVERYFATSVEGSFSQGQGAFLRDGHLIINTEGKVYEDVYDLVQRAIQEAINITIDTNSCTVDLRL